MSKVELHAWYRQYRQLKEQYPDAILLYRLGDFYEVFDDDAKLVAQLLDVTLTRKDYAVDKSKRPKSAQKLFCPMAGMPYHAVETYASKLVNMGYRVAVAEQLSETASSKSDTRPRSVFASGMETIAPQRGVAHREIVRVLTPGTVVDPSMLDTDRNNYLAAVIAEQEQIGLAYIELSTGEFAATEFHGERARLELEGELARLHVAELLVPDEQALCLPGLEPATARLTRDLAPMTKDEREMLLPHERVARQLNQESSARWVQGHITTLQAWQWELSTARDTLLQQLGVQSLAGFGLDEKPLAARAAGAVLHYIYQTQRNHAAQITTLRVYKTGTFMVLDPQTQRNLELLEGSSGKTRGALIGVLDATRTPMGTRLLRRWLSQPLLHLEALKKRQEAVARSVDDGLLRAALRQALGEVGDMERAVNRVVQGIGIATPRDLVYLRQALRALPAIIAAVGEQAAMLIADDDLQPTIRGSGPARTGVLPGTGSHRSAEQAEASKKPQRNGQTAQQQMLDLPPAGPAPRVVGDTLFDDDEEETTQTDHPTPDAQATTSDTQPTTLHPPPAAFDPRLLDPCSDVLAFLEHALDDEPPALLGASNYLRGEESGEKSRRVVRPGFDPRMDQVVHASIEAQNWINGLEVQERERTGIKSLKVDYNKVFGYYIEVSKANTVMVPKHYERKQTLVSAERYITAELKEYESVVLNAQQRLVELEREAFKRICEELYQHGERLRSTAQKLARLDVVAALAEVATREQYVRPILNNSTRLNISGGRHPVVEKALKEAFVPNDTTLDTSEEQLLVITGPNMAGKCVRGDTLLFTEQGLLPIAALMPDGAPEGEFTPIDWRVRGKHKQQTATHFYRGGRQRTISVTTRHGYHLEGTPEHRVWVRHRDGTQGWHCLGQISVGDVVAIERQLDIWGHHTDIDLPDVLSSHVTPEQNERLPAVITPDLAYLLGLLTGDGTRTDAHDICFSTTDPYVEATFYHTVEQIFGCVPARNLDGSGYAPGSGHIWRLLESFAGWCAPPHKKHVSHAVLRAPRHIAIGFLQGLFDSVQSDYNGAVVTTPSQRLAREVQLILLNLGIIASLHHTSTATEPCYHLSIDSADAATFHYTVGSRLPHTQQTQREVGSHNPHPTPGGWSAPSPNRVEVVSSSRRFYDTIVSVEASEAEVYDLCVENEHAYIASGFVSHNSTVLRQVALIVLMAQIGSFVPADRAEIGLVDRIFTRIGAQDDIATGQSTFMVEMTETAALLVQSSSRSLIILDEVGRGTSTYDGMAIARAVVEYIHNEPRLQCRTLFATHYHELTALEALLPRVHNYHMAAIERSGRVVFLYELRHGGTDRSYGIHVAELAGIPRPVIHRANELLVELEASRRQSEGRHQERAVDEQPVAATQDNTPPAHPTQDPSTPPSLLDAAPNPVITYLKRLNVNELTPIEAMTKLYELQKLAQEPFEE